MYRRMKNEKEFSYMGRQQGFVEGKLFAKRDVDGKVMKVRKRITVCGSSVS